MNCNCFLDEPIPDSIQRPKLEMPIAGPHTFYVVQKNINNFWIPSACVNSLGIVVACRFEGAVQSAY